MVRTSISAVERTETQYRNTRRRHKEFQWQLWLMVLPAVLFMLIFVYKPMGGIVIAFQDYSLKKGIDGSTWVGFSNFSRLFRSYWFPIIFKNTLSISLLSLILGFPAPILFALAANEIRSDKLKRTVQTISYIPHFISTVVVCGMLTVFLSPENGIINLILQMFNIEPVSFLAKPNAFKWVYVLSGIWQTIGWSAIIYIAALSGVDKCLLEAAEIDGANRFQKIRYVNFPILVPTIIIMFILRCGSILGVGYEKVYLLQNTANLSASEVISTYVYKVGLENADFGFSTATNLFDSVVNCIILLLSNKLSHKFTGSSLF